MRKDFDTFSRFETAMRETFGLPIRWIRRQTNLIHHPFTIEISQEGEEGYMWVELVARRPPLVHETRGEVRYIYAQYRTYRVGGNTPPPPHADAFERLLGDGAFIREELNSRTIEYYWNRKRYTLTEEAVRGLKEAGLQRVSWEPDFTSWAFPGGTLMYIPTMPGFLPYVHKLPDMATHDLEKARAGLTSYRRFLDAWELLERTVFKTEYLAPLGES